MTLLKDNRTYLVAELGINCGVYKDRSKNVQIAKDLISLSKEVGIDCVKFQKRSINDCYTEEELLKYRESPWGNTTREQKEGVEFTANEYLEITKFCKELKIDFTASPWDFPSIDFINMFDVPFIKIPSALATNKKFLLKCIETHNPLVLSTGMMDLKTIIEVVKFIIINGGKIAAILSCTSTYPSKVEEQNLLGIKTLQRVFPFYDIGFSSHFIGPSMAFAAAVMGAKMVEFHVTLDRSFYGSDQSSSLEPNGIRHLVRDIRDYEAARGDGNIVVYESELPIEKKLRKVNDFLKLTA